MLHGWGRRRDLSRAPRNDEVAEGGSSEHSPGCLACMCLPIVHTMGSQHSGNLRSGSFTWSYLGSNESAILISVNLCQYVIGQPYRSKGLLDAWFDTERSGRHMKA